MKRQLKIFFSTSLFLIFLSFLTSNLISYAEDENTGSAGFSYSINYPKTELGRKGYLDLLLKPNQEDTFSLTLNNPSDEEVNVEISIESAKTNKNGVIEYAPNEMPIDKSQIYPFEDIISGPKEITLKPKETKNVEFTIKAPKEEFDGIILGGISLIRSEKDDKKNEAGGSVVKNRYRYAIPVMIRNNNKEVKPKLEFRKAYAEQLNSKNTIYIDFSNISATFFDDMSVEVSISKKGEETVLYQTKKTSMRMAPNTLIQFPVSMQGEKMVPGNYTAKILVKGSKGVIERWTEDFKITKEQADKYNERDVGLYEEKTTNWKLIITIVVGVLLLIAIIYFILTKMNKKKQEDANKTSKKKNKKRNK